MQTIKYVAYHHTGGTEKDPYAKTQHHTWKNIDDFHKSKWNFKSTLDEYGGYNFFIDSDGNDHWFRAIGEETAAIIGHNKDTIQGCLAGNFIMKNGSRIEHPTDKQTKKMNFINNELLIGNYRMFPFIEGTKVNITVDSILGHSDLDPLRKCNCMPKGWARETYLLSKIVKPPVTSVNNSNIIELLDVIIKFIQSIKSKYLSKDKECNGCF